MHIKHDSSAKKCNIISLYKAKKESANHLNNKQLALSILVTRVGLKPTTFRTGI